MDDDNELIYAQSKNISNLENISGFSFINYFVCISNCIHVYWRNEFITT